MTRRARRTIFYLLVLLFLVLGTGLVLYAQGWRISFTTWRAEKVGAILVRPYPTNATITLAGKPIANQAGFLSQDTLMSGLLPGNYALTLAAPGYHDWTENAAVFPSLVTEFKYAVLVPDAPAAVSTTSVKDFTDASSGEFITQTEAGAIALGGTTTTVARGTIVSASANLQALIYRTATGNYAWYNFGAATTTDLSAALSRGGVNARTVTALTVDPYNATSFDVQSADRIWIFHAAQATTALIDRAPAGATFEGPLASSPTFLAWTQFKTASGTSAIVLYNKIGKTLAGSSSTLPGRTLELQWINGSLLGALQSDGSLYSYDVNAQKFQKIADDVKQFAVAGDGSAVAALEYNSFEILPIADPQTYHRFNLPDVAAATEVIWYKDADHLFVVYPDSVSYLDLADIGLRNYLTAANGTHPLYNSGQNVLYLINSAQKLEQFDFPN